MTLVSIAPDGRWSSSSLIHLNPSASLSDHIFDTAGNLYVVGAASADLDEEGSQVWAGGTDGFLMKLAPP